MATLRRIGGDLFAAVEITAALALDRVLRPLTANLGATPHETKRPLPGDEIVRDAATTTTRALTIDAPPEAVWPWIAQLGQDRAGFYGLADLENLFGAGMPDLDHVEPALQRREVGDKVWLARRDRLGGRAYLEVARFEPFHAMVLRPPPPEVHDGSWAFVVEPMAGGKTRLLVRSRARAPKDGRERLLTRVFDPIHFVMEWTMMRTLRARAERAWRA